MSSSTWLYIKEALNSTLERCCICCSCYAQEINHNRLEEQLPEVIVREPFECHENRIVTFDEDFVLDVLEDPNFESWDPQLQFREEQQHRDIDLGSGPNAISPYRKDSKESGYGRSIEESHCGSSVDVETYVVDVVKGSSKNVLRIMVKNRRRCWSVERTVTEFYQLQKIIKNTVGKVSSKLPSREKLSAQHLDDFTQLIIAHDEAIKLPEIRLFYKLDFESAPSKLDSDPLTSLTEDDISSIGTDDTETNKEDSSQNNNHEVTINPNLLTVPGAPIPSRKKQGEVIKSSETSMNGIQLGCEEKKMSPKDFAFMSVIGKGSFGRVMLAKKKDDNKIYAVKILSKKMILRRNETAHVLSERSVLIRVLKHPYLVQLHYAFTTPNKIFFVLDYINGGELFFHLQKERTFTEKRAQFYAAEICCAISYMHTKGIIYRDLKPENILLDRDGHIVLTDFGLCKEGLHSGSSKTSTFCGTPEYLAPEIILKKAYTRSVDWWTLGAVLHEMLYGLPPFYCKDIPKMYDAILYKPLRLRNTVSSRARSILNGLLQKNHMVRLGSGPNDGEDVKKHSFFNDIEWPLIAERGINPPFIPIVANDADISNIDPQFTMEAVSSPHNSPPYQGIGGPWNQHSPFQNFSYVPTEEESDFRL